MRSTLGRLYLCVLLLTPLACGDSTGPGPSIAGGWSGTYTHPASPGTIEVTFEESGDVLNGTFAIQFGIGGGQVTNASGPLIGTRQSESNLTFTLGGTTFTWVFTGQLSGNDITGTWVSAASGGLNGTFTLTRGGS